MGRKKNLVKLEELFAKNGFELIQYNSNGMDFGKCWIHKISKEYLVNEVPEVMLEFKFLLDYKIDTFSNSIGFSEANQKWYSWSHRAIFGFGIGSEVKEGDIAYNPISKEDFEKKTTNYWMEESEEPNWNKTLLSIERDVQNPDESLNTLDTIPSDAGELVNELSEGLTEAISTVAQLSSGRLGFILNIQTNFKGEQIGREPLNHAIWTMYPDEYGEGCWTAKTLDDAYRMAVQFKKGI